LVKEADALAEEGYQVTVLYAYWNEWGAAHDKQLLAGKKWDAKCIGGDPEQNKITWFMSRLIHKIAHYLVRKNNGFESLADIAIARSSYFLIKAAKKHKAALYIAHNLGALPAAGKTARYFKKPFGFDAEDFHRQEVNDDVNSLHFKLSAYVEDKYLPLTDYITASSPLIANQYASLYNRPVTSILNVFPKTADTRITDNRSTPLKLFWFSQTIGPKRGLETIIDAMALTQPTVELHLLGNPSAGYQQELLQLAQNNNLEKGRIIFYPPIKASAIFNMAAQFDIGLASETGFCLNNNIALSNKLFTYIQSGLALVTSATPAQQAFTSQYPQTGKTYNNAAELSAILTDYDQDRELLLQTKKEAFKIGQTELNWERESQKFSDEVKAVLKASPGKRNPPDNWFYGVNSIRFILALVVMLRHISSPYTVILTHSAHSITRYLGYFLANAFDGPSAVIAFFIISGFVIHYPNKNGLKSLEAFWVRRLLRIIIPLSVILIAGSWFGHPEQTVVWSLVCELFYYALYPLFWKIPLSWKNKFFVAYSIAGLVICTLCFNDVIALVKQTNQNYQGYYWQLGLGLTWIAGLPCWLLGVLIAEHIDKINLASFGSVIFYRVLVYTISCICSVGKFHLHLSYILSMNIFALLLYKWIQTEIVYFKTRRPYAFLERMGKFSYSLYLCHPLFYVILGLFLGHKLATYPLYIILIIFISYLFYLTIENPSHKLAKAITRRLKPAVS
jgi:peptidoglycan/LPS O-acetylase OafA/YrhL/glycosyltransferase involved in cell wall biosynthesis